MNDALNALLGSDDDFFAQFLPEEDEEDLASPSQINNNFILFNPSDWLPSTSEEDEEEDLSSFLEVSLLSVPSIPSSALKFDYMQNVVVVKGRLNNVNCALLVNAKDWDDYTVYNGTLHNLSETIKTVRLQYNTNISNADYDIYTYTLYPIIQSNINIHNYGSNGYITHYYRYWQTSGSGGYWQIRNTQSYGTFYVDNIDFNTNVSNNRQIGLILAILGGVIAFMVFLSGKRR